MFIEETLFVWTEFLFNNADKLWTNRTRNIPLYNCGHTPSGLDSSILYAFFLSPGCKKYVPSTLQDKNLINTSSLLKRACFFFVLSCRFRQKFTSNTFGEWHATRANSLLQSHYARQLPHQRKPFCLPLTREVAPQSGDGGRESPKASK